MKMITKESLWAGMAGGIVSAVIAFLIAYFVVPAPLNLLDVSIGNALCGFFSGLMSGFVGVYLVLKNIAANSKALKLQQLDVY